MRDVAEEITVGFVGSMSLLFVPCGIPLLRGQNVKPGKLDLSNLKRISNDTHRKWKKSALSGGDVVIVRVGEPGTACVIPEGMGDLNAASLVIVRPIKEKLDSRFLCYMLNSNKGKELIRSRLVGSVQNVLNTATVAALEIPLPSLRKQCEISHILGTLDDKIELNRKMSTTLEEMARALFKSWFVDFDPVRAKAEGLPTGLPPGIDELFPDSFVDSALGEIPKGWEVSCVDDEFNLTMGQSPPGDTYNTDGMGLPFYQGRADFSFRFPNRRMYCSSPSRLAQSGDTLISVRAPVGDINMASEECCIGRGVAASRHKSGSRSFTYYYMRSIKEVFDRFEADGTVFGSISKKDFHAIACVRPRSTLINEFESLLTPIDNRIEVNVQESRTLAALRDTLLPKLISGELRVGETKDFADDRGH